MVQENISKGAAFLMGEGLLPIIWGQNFAPDLLESIKQPRLAKRELGRTCMKVSRLGPKGISLALESKNLGFAFFRCPEN